MSLIGHVGSNPTISARKDTDLRRCLFVWREMVGFEQGGSTAQRQSNESPSGAFISPRVPTGRNVKSGRSDLRRCLFVWREMVGFEQGATTGTRRGGVWVPPGRAECRPECGKKTFFIKNKARRCFLCDKNKKNMPYSLGYMDFSRNNMKKSSKTMAFLFWIC